METLNINVGILGHVDSGKTELARSLSSTLSTASLDHAPQSQERGMTLDLGFSAFSSDIPERLRQGKFDKIQFTLVDCPGHASLLKTVIGGAQIIDLMLLVIDITKGIQAQTAECIVLGEILATREVIVVLNKADLLKDEKERMKKIKKLRSVFSKTKLGADLAMVSVSALKGEIDDLKNALLERAPLPERTQNAPEELLFAFEHGFKVDGQGTVLTGTVLKGSVSVGQMVEIADLNASKKVKSIQMFHKPAEIARQGDRAALCLANVSADKLERGLVAAPGTLKAIQCAVAEITPIKHYNGICKSRSVVHLVVGHTNLEASVHFFTVPTDEEISEHSPIGSVRQVAAPGKEFESECLDLTQMDKKRPKQYALLSFKSRSIKCPENALIIAAKLVCRISPEARHNLVSCINMELLLLFLSQDSVSLGKACRLMFHGRIVKSFSNKALFDEFASQLKIYRPKQREGSVSRIQNATTVLTKDLFVKQTAMEIFMGMKVELGTQVGVVDGTFGTSGKVKIRFSEDLEFEETDSKNLKSTRLVLKYKKYTFSNKKVKIFQ